MSSHLCVWPLYFLILSSLSLWLSACFMELRFSFLRGFCFVSSIILSAHYFSRCIPRLKAFMFYVRPKQSVFLVLSIRILLGFGFILVRGSGFHSGYAKEEKEEIFMV
jgi:hypothetical protein